MYDIKKFASYVTKSDLGPLLPHGGDPFFPMGGAKEITLIVFSNQYITKLSFLPTLLYL